MESFATIKLCKALHLSFFQGRAKLQYILHWLIFHLIETENKTLKHNFLTIILNLCAYLY